MLCLGAAFPPQPPAGASAGTGAGDVQAKVCVCYAIYLSISPH